MAQSHNVERELQIKVAHTRPASLVWETRSIWKMLGPFVTASRHTLHYHSPDVTTVASHAACTSRRRRQRVTEGTAMAPWNGHN